MSEPQLPRDVVAARRQLARDAERTCRVLREYARKLHRITIELLALGAEKPYRPYLWVGAVDKDALAHSVVPILLRRRAVIAGMVEDHCRAASGMVEAGTLPLAVKSELLLRLRETENALVEVREASQHVVQRFPRLLSKAQLADVPIPDLAAIERRRKAARDAVDAQQPQPVG